MRLGARVRMLKHRHARRQGRARSEPAARSLTLYPGIAHVDAGQALSLYPVLDSHPLRDGQRQVYAGGVADYPVLVVPTSVVVVEVGRLGLGYAAWEVVPHVPFSARAPVVVARVPRPDLLDRGTGATPVSNRPETDLAMLLTELEPLVRQGDLVPAERVVVGRVDLALHAAGPGSRELGILHRSLRGLLALLRELRVHPLLEMLYLILGQQGFYAGLRPGDGLPDPLVVVGRGGLLRPALGGRSRERLVLFAYGREDAFHLLVVEAELAPELLGVAILRKDESYGRLLGIRVRRVRLCRGRLCRGRAAGQREAAERDHDAQHQPRPRAPQHASVYWRDHATAHQTSQGQSHGGSPLLLQTCSQPPGEY